MKKGRYLTERRFGLILLSVGLFLLIPAHHRIRDRFVEVLSDVAVVEKIVNLEPVLLGSYTLGLVITTVGFTLVLRYTIWDSMKKES